MRPQITRELIIDYIFNLTSEEESQKLTEAIKNDEIIREWYLFEKRCVDIEKYHLNDLSLGDSLELKELLKNNPKLNEHFELSKSVNNVLEMQSVLEQLKDIYQELYCLTERTSIETITPIKPKLLRFGKWLSAASILLLFVLSGSSYMFSNRSKIEDKLFSKYYEPFQNNTKNYFNSSPILKAKSLYANNESGDAFFILDNMPGSIDIEPERNLYLGLVLMELERYNEAIEKFKMLQQDEEPSVSLSISHWYLALSYLVTDDKADAVKILEHITRNKSYNYKNAEKILKKLN